MACKHLEDQQKVPSGACDDGIDGTWIINGCGRGSCYGVIGVIYCPFCGEKISKNDDDALRRLIAMEQIVSILIKKIMKTPEGKKMYKKWKESLRSAVPPFANKEALKPLKEERK